MISRLHDLSQMIFCLSQSLPSFFLSSLPSSDDSDLNCQSHHILVGEGIMTRCSCVLWPYRGLSPESAVSWGWALVRGWRQPSGTKEQNSGRADTGVRYHRAVLVSLDTLEAGIRPPVMWVCPHYMNPVKWRCSSCSLGLVELLCNASLSLPWGWQSSLCFHLQGEVRKRSGGGASSSPGTSALDHFDLSSLFFLLAELLALGSSLILVPFAPGTKLRKTSQACAVPSLGIYP